MLYDPKRSYILPERPGAFERVLGAIKSAGAWIVVLLYSATLLWISFEFGGASHVEGLTPEYWP
jgi:hypothetical protein